MIPWQLPVLLRVAIGEVAGKILLKRAADQETRALRLFLQYCFGIALATAFALWRKELIIDNLTLAIVGLGLANGLAASFYWEALRISLSRNAIATFLDDLIAMGLSYVILKEGRFLNAWLVTGIGISVAAAVFYSVRAYRKSANDQELRHGHLRLPLYIGAYSVIWGVAAFLMRYLGTVKAVPTGRFLFGWYVGTFIAVMLLFLFRERGRVYFLLARVRAGELVEVFALMVVVMSALGLAYWSFLLAPQTVVQPIYLVSEMILPALIGLWVFKEIKGLDAIERLLFVAGGLGALLIVISF